MEPTADGSAEDAATEGMAAEAALADGQYELALNNADAPMVDPKDACVLHYANLGIEAFVDKYTLRRLGALEHAAFPRRRSYSSE